LDPTSLSKLAVVVAVAAGIVLYQAIRKPVMRRLAARDATRRPGETALVIMGSLLGTALITGSFIVGDTLNSSVRVTAYTQLGPVDEIVTVPDLDKAGITKARISSIEDPAIDGVMGIVVVPASVTAGAGKARLAEPDAQLIEADFEIGKSFGGDASLTGISVPEPEAGHVVLTEDLARTLEVTPGDSVFAYVFDRKLALTIDRLLPRVGLAGYSLAPFQDTSPNAFVAPGTMHEVAKDVPAGAVPPAATILISNRGGVEEGVTLTSRVTGLVDDALGTEASLRVDPVKKTKLDNAKAQGDSFTQLFVGIGAFAIVAGILLLVNIFVMLAEERKQQLGMLRAVGMRRADLVRSFVIEGALYSVVASLVGAGLGIGVGWAIVKLAAPIFAGSAGSDFGLSLSFAARWSSVAGGFCVGLLISLATILLTSLRISRINIIRAIRDLNEPLPREARWRTVIIGGAVTAAAAGWLFVSLNDPRAWAGQLLGPPIAVFGLLPHGSRLVGRRTSVLVAALFSLLWGIFGNSILNDTIFQSGSINTFVFQGILLTFSAVLLLSQTQETLEGFLRRVAASRLSLRLGLAYPLAKRFRTGLTLGMYALVVFTMTFIAVLSNVFGGQVDTTTASAAGGYDMVVTAASSNPPAADDVALLPGVDDVAAVDYGGALYQPEGVATPQEWPISGIDADFVNGGPPKLSKRLPTLTSAAAVWHTLLTDPDTAIIDSFFLQGGGGPPSAIVTPGQTMDVIDPVTGARVERKIIGVVDIDQAFAGVFMSKGSVHDLLGDRISPSRIYVASEGTQDELDRLATSIQGRFFKNAAEAQTFRSLVEEQAQASLQFLRLMQGYLALGLLVGIAGLGVLMVRAVRERRREIGVLRSLGFPSERVRAAFVFEAGFVALEGIVIGAALALVTASQLVANGDFGKGIEFVIPWNELGILCGAAFVASLIATAWPARQASRIPPAVALRVAD
jgi:putative ABC transport system permease protein